MTRYPLNTPSLHDVEREYLDTHGFEYSTNGTEWTRQTADGGYIMLWHDGTWNIMFKPGSRDHRALAVCGQPSLLVFTDVINWVEDNIDTAACSAVAS